MIVNGTDIANRLYTAIAHEVSQCSHTPTMAAITCAPNFETKKYLDLKKRKAAAVGVALRVIELPETVTTSEVVASVAAVAKQVDGVVVQLPFPPHIDRETVLQAVPVSKDPDGFSFATHDGAMVPPVTGAILEIAKAYEVSFLGKQVVVLGAGRLVGAPIATYLEKQGVRVTVLTDASSNYETVLQAADIIITGVGKPHFVTPVMVKDGVIVFDAGTSEDGGVMVGDVDPAVVEKAALFTPVPGGIGPVTVAVLLRNLITLVKS